MFASEVKLGRKICRKMGRNSRKNWKMIANRASELDFRGFRSKCEQSEKWDFNEVECYTKVPTDFAVARNHLSVSMETVVANFSEREGLQLLCN